MNILLTGGRAPATLELARAFHRAGHIVFMAESLAGHLSQPSNAVTKNFIVPPPRQQTKEFTQAIKDIVLQNKIDLLIPTCEEIFYIAMARDEIQCKVFAEPINKLHDLHNKWLFAFKAIEASLLIPESMIVVTVDDLLHAYAHWKELVLKPVYSRFASRTLMRPTLKNTMATLEFDPDHPWVAQVYLQGKQICSYSICHNGHITAHTAYPVDFTAGQGAAIHFQHIDHPAIFNWVKTFVDHHKFSGQIAFDFIQTSDGHVYALECNPRATSGVHLLATSPQFIEAFLNPTRDCITPSPNHSRMLAAAMFIYGFPASIGNGKLGSWFSTFFSSDDVILDFKDIKPALLQFRSLFSYMKIARQNNISTLQASTFDIEWNGD